MSIRAWRIVFLVGLVFCIGVAAVAFGPTWVLGIAGVVTIAIGVITQLTGHKDSFTRELKRLLNIKSLLRFATATVWAVSIGLGVYAIRKAYRELNPPPPPPPFRVSYFLLENYAADLLLQGKIDKEWEDKLAGQSYIVPSPAFQTLSYLERTFSDKLPEPTAILLVNKPVKHGQQDRRNDKNDPVQSFDIGQNAKVFAGNLLYPGREINVEELPRYIRQLKDPTQPWKVFQKGYGGEEDSPFIFRTYAGRRDLNLLADSRYKQFNLYLARETIPPDFGYVDIYVDYSAGCGGGEDSFTTIEFVGRTPKLRVAVVENITDQPIKLGRFTIRETKIKSLRSPEEEQALLNAQPSEERAWFAPEILKPGERIIIPVELLMGFRPTEDLGEMYVGSVDLQQDPDLLKQYKGSGSADFPGVTRGSWFSIDAKTVDAILARQGAKFPLNEDYVYGPSVRIESVEIAGVSYPFREFDASRLVITEGFEMGSCPYVYTYSPDSQTWTREGVILYALNEKRKESWDERPLQKFDGRVLIKEEDDEESFIDSVFVRAIALDGQETILNPANIQLAATDNRYVSLKKGDQLLVEFPRARNAIGVRYVLEAVGYYIPNKPKWKRSPAQSGSIR